MVPEHSLLEVLIAITDIANNRTPAFEQKLKMILQQIVGCMQAKKASIMLLKRKGTLEVVASTNPAIIGVRQSLEDPSPSSWVFRHRQPLYADSASDLLVFSLRPQPLQIRLAYRLKDALPYEWRSTLPSGRRAAARTGFGRRRVTLHCWPATNRAAVVVAGQPNEPEPQGRRQNKFRHWSDCGAVDCQNMFL